MDLISLKFIAKKLKSAHEENSIRRKEKSNSKFDQICIDFWKFLNNELESGVHSEVEKRKMYLTSKVLEKVVDFSEISPSESNKLESTDKESILEKNFEETVESNLKNPLIENSNKIPTKNVKLNILSNNRDKINKNQININNKTLENDKNRDKMKIFYKSVNKIKSSKTRNVIITDKVSKRDKFEDPYSDINDLIFTNYPKLSNFIPFSSISRIDNIQKLPNSMKTLIPISVPPFKSPHDYYI